MMKSECYKGLRVRIVREGGVSPGYRNCTTTEMREMIGNNRIYTIDYINTCGVYFEETSLGWDWSWLEPISNLDAFCEKIGKLKKVKYTREKRP